MNDLPEWSELLDLAIASPEEAERRAHELLAQVPRPLERSFADHCLGIVARDRGHLVVAIKHLDAALRAARAAGRRDREADVRATRGVTLVFAGRTGAGLREFDQALAFREVLPAELQAKVLLRQAAVLAGLLGRDRDAIGPIRAALEVLQVAGDRRWEARSRVWLAGVEGRLGRVEAGMSEARAAERILADLGDLEEQVSAVEQQASLALLGGDLAAALDEFARASRLQEQLGSVGDAAGVQKRARAYLAAGLPADAVRLLVEDRERRTPDAADHADNALLLAEAAMAMGDAPVALKSAQLAESLLRRQQRTSLAVRARWLSVRATDRMAQSAPERRGLARSAATVAKGLDAEGAAEAPAALVFAGQVANAASSASWWSAAATYRHSPGALIRAGAWLGQGLLQESRDDRGGILRAASSGLDAIDEHRRLIGSSELRALATTHGRELTALALRHAANDPRTLLRWSERTRATALAQPPVTSDVATIPASLAALRDNGRRLAEARQEGEPTDELERERLRLERAVRAESHTLSAASAEGQKLPRVEEIVAAVGDGCLVELVDVDGVLHVLVVHSGRVRRRVAGRTEDVAALLAPAQMLLRRASRGRATDMTTLGSQLQQAILGDAVRLIPDGPVVLAPTARLHGLPWGILPALADRPFSVVPSSGQWLRARARRRPNRDRRRTLLVAGPGLDTGGAEVPLLAEAHPDAALLEGPDATLEAVMAGLDGADLVHLAAHGHFRADSPLFSSLDVADGPLTVHDLERVRRAPYRVVLSACESGVLAPVGSEELLGLAAALFSLGSAGLVCSVAEVNDAATADLMVALHAGLAAGRRPAEALHEVRRAVADDPVAAGTAAAFLALGV